MLLPHVANTTTISSLLSQQQLAHGYTLIDQRCPDPSCDLPLLREKREGGGAGPLECVAVSLGWHGDLRAADLAATAAPSAARSSSIGSAPAAAPTTTTASGRAPAVDLARSPTPQAVRARPTEARTPTTPWSITKIQLDEHSGRRAGRNERVRALQTSSSALRSTLSPDARSSSSAHAVADGLRLEVEDLRGVLAEAHDKLAAHSAESQRKAVGLESEIRRLKLQLGHAGTRGDAMHLQSTRELEEASSMVDRLQREIITMHSDATEADRMIDELHARAALGEDSHRRAAALQTETTALEARIARATDELSASQAESRRHRERAGELTTSLNLTSSGVKELRAQLLHREGTAEVLAKRHAAERAAMASTHVALEAAVAEAEARADDAISAANAHFHATDAKLEAIVSEHRALHERQQSVLMTTSEEGEAAAAELAREVAATAAARAREAKAMDALARERARVASLEAQRAAFEDEAAAASDDARHSTAEWSAQIDSLRADLATHVMANEELKARDAVHAATAAGMRERQDAAIERVSEAAREELARAVANFASDKRQHAGEVDLATVAVVDAERRRGEEAAKVEKLSIELEAAHASIEDLEIELDVRKAQAEQGVQAEAEVEHLRIELARERRIADVDADATRDETSALRERCASLTNQLTTLNVDLDAAHLHECELVAENNALRSALEDRQDELDAVRSEAAQQRTSTLQARSPGWTEAREQERWALGKREQANLERAAEHALEQEAQFEAEADARISREVMAAAAELKCTRAADAAAAAEEEAVPADPWAVDDLDVMAMLSQSPELRKIMQLFPPEKGSDRQSRTIFSLIWIVFRHFAFSGGGDAMHASSISRMQARSFARSLGVLKEREKSGGSFSSSESAVPREVMIDTSLSDIYFSSCLAKKFTGGSLTGAMASTHSESSKTALSLPQFRAFLLLLAKVRLTVQLFKC